MGKKDQVSITLSQQERELAKKIADQLGMAEAQVLRQAALTGLDDLLEILERRQKFLEKGV